MNQGNNRNSMNKRVGIFGGTFDPPHIGHLILAGEAVDSLNLDTLLWLLTPDPPHKKDQSILTWQHRLAMLELCLTNHPDFQVSRLDIDRPGPHYAVDTVKLLANEYPDAIIVYIMGGDSLRNLATWYKPKEFIDACHELGVMRRPGDRIDLDLLERDFPDIKNKVKFMDAPLLGISSEQIRIRIARNRPFRYYVTSPVYQYIEDHQLYC